VGRQEFCGHFSYCGIGAIGVDCSVQQPSYRIRRFNRVSGYIKNVDESNSLSYGAVVTFAQVRGEGGMNLTPHVTGFVKATYSLECSGEV
jgi:hypothetical protein